jgi:hypothetical protein
VRVPKSGGASVRVCTMHDEAGVRVVCGEGVEYSVVVVVCKQRVMLSKAGAGSWVLSRSMDDVVNGPRAKHLADQRTSFPTPLPLAAIGSRTVRIGSRARWFDSFGTLTLLCSPCAPLLCATKKQGSSLPHLPNQHCRACSRWSTY